MECERLKRLVRHWYVQVQDESMAPARMVDFMRNHVEDCMVCMGDPLAEIEVKRIAEIVLPPAKTTKTVRKDKEANDDVPDSDIDSDETEEEDITSEDDQDDVDPDEDDEEEDEDDEI
ncbi:MAG: hypothetical protein LC633_02190 [Desulfobulbaceae bacterium]|nr:hypothetical protein [Desulfobulbaceae bacterium]